MKTKCFFEEISTEEILSINGGGLSSKICNDIISKVAKNGECVRYRDSYTEDRLRKITNKLIDQGYVVRLTENYHGREQIHITKANN